jgi:hypothetical protein
MNAIWQHWKERNPPSLGWAREALPMDSAHRVAGLLLVIGLSGCSGGISLGSLTGPAEPPPPAAAATAPPAPGIASEDLVGRWGFTSYHRETDRTRTLTLRWVDPEVAGRYGTSVYVRCPSRA